MVELDQLFGWLEPSGQKKRPNALENIRSIISVEPHTFLEKRPLLGRLRLFCLEG